MKCQTVNLILTTFLCLWKISYIEGGIDGVQKFSEVDPKQDFAQIQIHGQYSQVASNRAVRSDRLTADGEKCPPNGTGRFAYAKDCRKYLYCMKGRGQVKTCESNKRFNIKTNKCDMVANVPCHTHEALKKPEEGPQRITLSQRFTEPDSDDFGTIGVELVGPRVECERGVSGLFEHPYDCSKFVNCANGVTYIQDCGRGTVYNPQMKACDWPYNVDCAERTPRQQGESHSNYRDRTKKNYGEGVIQPRNSFEIVIENMEEQPLRSNVKRSERTSLNSGNKQREVQEEQVSRVEVHDQYSQVASNRPKSTVHFARSDSGTFSERFVAPNSNDREPRRKNVDDEDTGYFSPVGTECPPESTGQFPYLMDCRQYLNCWKGRGYIQSCNPGTLFNPLTRECDFPSKVKCVTLDLLNNLDSHEAVRARYRELEDVREAVPEPSNRRETFAINPRFSEDFDYDGNPVDPNAPVVECEKYTSGLFEHPFDCSKFLNCANGATYIQNCGEGTLFNPLYKVCDWPKNVDCNGRSGYGESGALMDFREPKTFVVEPPAPVFQPRIDLDIAAGDLARVPAQKKQTERFQTRGSTSEDSDKHSMPIYRRPSSTTTTTTSRPATAYRRFSTVQPLATHLLPPKLPDKQEIREEVAISSRQDNLQTSQRSHEPRQLASIMSVNKSNRNYQQAKQDSDGQSSDAVSNTAALLPLSEALKLMLRPYLNRSGTIAEDVNYNLQLPILTTTSTEPPISKEQESLIGIDDKQESSETDEGHSNRGNFNNQRPGGTKFQHSDDFHRNHPDIPFSRQSGTTSQRPAGFQHSEDYHRHHPHIPYPDQSAKVSQRPAGFQHSEDYHRRHPEIPYPDQTAETSQRPAGFQHSEDYHRRHPHIPYPSGAADETHGTHRQGHSPDFHRFGPHHHRHHHKNDGPSTTEANVVTRISQSSRGQPPPPSTTPTTVYFNREYPLFVAPLATFPPPVAESNQFDCQNGQRIDEALVCDGKEDCKNRKDEADCEHIGYEVRLSSDTGNKNEGRVEVKAYGQWGYICDDKFGMVDADVLCRELGFEMGAQEVRLNSFYAANPNFNSDAGLPLFVMDEIECVGNETSLKDCKFNGWGVHDCNAEEIVGVVCKLPAVMTCPQDYWLCSTSQECIPTGFLCDNVPDCTDGSDENTEHCNAALEFRLAGGRTRFEGRVEVKYRGIWGTVCDDEFGEAEANVICRSLGLNGPSTSVKNAFPPGTNQIWLDQVKCVGNETNLDKCSHWHWGEHNCGHTEDVGVRCTITGTRQRFNPDSEEFHPSVIQHERSGRILPTECGIVKVEQNIREPDFHFKVVRGTTAKKGFHPWQASIRAKKQAKSAHWCGAVLISKFHLLTAAHCLVGYPKGAYVIRLGDHLSDQTETSEVEIYIENFYIHEEFRKGQHMNNDIAVVLLKSPVRFTDYIQPVCLPTKDTVYAPGKNCTISGWGATQSGSSLTSSELHAGSIPILAPEICQQKEVYGKYITDGMFCAGSLEENVDACDGDSGGPLICPNGDGSNTLFGIISWGQHCGYANKPGVYVKVSHYLDWINEKLNLTYNNFGV